MQKIKAFFIFLLLFSGAFAQEKIWVESPEEKTERLAWWTHDRFGMFIHWGLYAMPARHEWVMTSERISVEDYKKYFNLFDPDLYNPAEWAKMAKETGMKYAVITVKHHDGFCLFNSEFTDYKAVNTPAGRDLIKEWVDAFRAEGIRIGFYYSMIDWHHPHYTIDRIHPLNPASDSDFRRLNQGRNMAIYREYMFNQVREILSNYGQIDILWLDYSFPGERGKSASDWGSVELIKMVRELQPRIIINDRADLKNFAGGWDFVTPEQFKVPEWPTEKGIRVPWETCQTFSGSWGYYRDELTWKDSRQLLGLLIESVSKGGNLLLNVGPTARGYIDCRAEHAMKKMGAWMKFNSRSIYGCTKAPDGFVVPENCLLTYNPRTNRLYIHLLEYPLENFYLPGYKNKVKYAQFLHDGSELLISSPAGHWIKQEVGENDINLRLPVVKPNVEIPVIELILK